MESQQYSHVHIGANDDVRETGFQNRRGCLCFTWSTSSMPPSSDVGLNWWQRIRTSDYQDNSIWSRGVNALKKVREWSEIVAGPKWKTFIRRFNRNNNKRPTSNYQYDALSYAQNFDDGHGTIDDSGEVEEDYGMRNFSVRYAAIPASVKSSSMDLGKDGPSFV